MIRDFYQRSCLLVFLLVLVSGLPLATKATDFNSPSFILRDPIITIGGTYTVSDSFRYFSSLGETIIGENASDGFIYRSGFLYFPVVNAPVLGATAGDGEVQLDWTAATAFLGHTITAYEAGQSVTIGGPYVFTNVGNVVTATVGGLTNGTPYYFVVRALDAFGNPIATSNEATATPVSAAPPSGGGISQARTELVFSGLAYPNSPVYVLADGQVTATVTALTDAKFSATVSGLLGGAHTFAIWTEDAKGRRSSLYSFALYVESGKKTSIGGIFLSPTIDVNQGVVKQGDPIIIEGQTVPGALITITLNPTGRTLTTQADSNGKYSLLIQTGSLALGIYEARAEAESAGATSQISPAVSFEVGLVTIPKEVPVCGLRGDLNCDKRVNLIDFSIAAYWFERPFSDSFRTIERERLNGDEVIDLIDFSIMSFFWTG